MRKIRIGNDFLVAWRIKRAGINEDLTNAVNMSVVASVKAEGQIHSVVVPFDIVDDSIIRVEMTPAIAQWEGIYNFVLKYEFEYPSYVDNNEKVAVDKNAFIIVSRTSQADEITLIDIESDVLIGLKGEKGDSAFTVWNKANGGDNTYQDWIDFLQSPANEIEGIVSANEAIRIDNENTRKSNETARKSSEATRTSNEQTRQSNESDRVDSEGLRIASESVRVGAEDGRVSAENQRVIDETKRETLYDNTVILKGQVETLKTETETATQGAITATSQANTARDNAITATTNANDKALYAQEQGDYAKAQGEVVAGYTLITTIEGTIQYNELNII